MNFSDPFGLLADTSWVGCRSLKGVAGAVGNHCAVAVGENGSYQFGELLNNEGTNQVDSTQTVESLLEDYKWTPVPVPDGMTQERFDAAVIRSYYVHQKSWGGYAYSSHSLFNSNYFVFSVFRLAGGKIPRSAAPGGLTPGLCGGGKRFALGKQCSP